MRLLQHSSRRKSTTCPVVRNACSLSLHCCPIFFLGFERTQNYSSVRCCLEVFPSDDHGRPQQSNERVGRNHEEDFQSGESTLPFPFEHFFFFFFVPRNIKMSEAVTPRQLDSARVVVTKDAKLKDPNAFTSTEDQFLLLFAPLSKAVPGVVGWCVLEHSGKCLHSGGVLSRAIPAGTRETQFSKVCTVCGIVSRALSSICTMLGRCFLLALHTCW